MKIVRFIDSDKTLSVGKILCVGRNYAEHAKEMASPVPKIPVIFLKPATAVISDGEQILFPAISQELHHEVELVVAIGRAGRHIQASEALAHVAGYAVGFDMTLRDLQSEAKKKGLPWSVAKGFDTSAPVSRIVPAARIADPHALMISCRVNGALRQRSSTAQMIFSIPRVIEYVSSVFTLEEGDLLYTGTPEGVGAVGVGDELVAELEGYVTTTHRIAAA